MGGGPLMRSPQKVQQFALAYFRRQVGPWRSTRDAALEDAIRRGDASRDRKTKVIFLTVPADIIERSIWVEAHPGDNIVPLRVRPHLRLVE